MGLPPQDDQPRHSSHDKVQMATDELVRFVFIRLISHFIYDGIDQVMERFKKRMRKQ
jgi:hypothetical protein